MAYENKLLIVVNPTSKDQPAIARAVAMAKADSSTRPDITLLMAVDLSSTDNKANNPDLYRDEKWFRDIIAPLQAVGIEPSARISWSSDWAESIVFCAEELGVDTIILSHPGKAAKGSFSDEFWYLMRNAPVPICVVQSAQAPGRRPILAAMDVQDKEILDLNRRILNSAKEAAEIYGSELHFANAYRDSSNYPDRAKIAEKVGVPNDQIHLKSGSPYEALGEIASKLNPAMIVVGASRRTGFRAALRGKKLGDILMNIEHDLLVVV